MRTPALLLFALALTACNRGSGSAEVRPTNEQTAPIRVAAAAAQARTLPRTLDVTGTLMADQSSDVTSIVPGHVMEVLVERGQTVEEGAALVKLRDVDYRLAVAAARAQLAQAQARLGIEGNTDAPRADETAEVLAARANRDLAAEQLTRAEQLVQSGAMSSQQLDQARAAAVAAREQYNSAVNGMRAASSQLQAARVALSQSSSALAESTVRAPFAGEIADRFVEVGEYVTPQSRVVTLVKTHPLRLEVQVPQEQIGAIRVGQQVQVHVDAFPDRTFAGTIRYISAAVRADTRGLVVEATIDNTDGSLRPGLFAQARIDLGGTRNAAVIPESAVLVEAGTPRAFVIVDGVVEERILTILERSGEEVVVGDGVRPGERVATESLDQLADGERVAS